MAGAESWRVSGGRRVRAAPLGLAAPFPSAPALSAASAAVRGLLVGVEALSRAAARLPPLLRARRAARLRPLARRLRRLPRLGEGARHRRAGIAGSGGGEEKRGEGAGREGRGWAGLPAVPGSAQRPRVFQEALCESERARVLERKKHGAVWALRSSPPPDWHRPLQHGAAK